MATKRAWVERGLNAALVGAVVYVIGGWYGKSVDYQARHVSIEMDPAAVTPDAAQRLSGEDWRQIDCLARNSYFEARNQGQDGLQAVNSVVFNRMNSGLFPKDACAVVSQCDPVSGVCQFSWFHDGRDHTIRDKEAWRLSMTVALNQWLYRSKMPDQTGGATRYKNGSISAVKWPKWKQTVEIGLHQFFKPKAPQS